MHVHIVAVEELTSDTGISMHVDKFYCIVFYVRSLRLEPRLVWLPKESEDITDINCFIE